LGNVMLMPLFTVQTALSAIEGCLALHLPDEVPACGHRGAASRIECASPQNHRYQIAGGERSESDADLLQRSAFGSSRWRGGRYA
jgi:hypothetical protein